MAENIDNNGCSQRDSAQPKLLEAILYKDNFNRAYKRVKANKGAAGIDGMTVEEALQYGYRPNKSAKDAILKVKEFMLRPVLPMGLNSVSGRRSESVRRSFMQEALWDCLH